MMKKNLTMMSNKDRMRSKMKIILLVVLAPTATPTGMRVRRKELLSIPTTTATTTTMSSSTPRVRIAWSLDWATKDAPSARHSHQKTTSWSVPIVRYELAVIAQPAIVLSFISATNVMIFTVTRANQTFDFAIIAVKDGAITVKAGRLSPVKSVMKSVVASSVLKTEALIVGSARASFATSAKTTFFATCVATSFAKAAWKVARWGVVTTTFVDPVVRRMMMFAVKSVDAVVNAMSPSSAVNARRSHAAVVPKRMLVPNATNLFALTVKPSFIPVAAKRRESFKW